MNRATSKRRERTRGETLPFFFFGGVQLTSPSRTLAAPLSTPSSPAATSPANTHPKLSTSVSTSISSRRQRQTDVICYPPRYRRPNRTSVCTSPRYRHGRSLSPLPPFPVACLHGSSTAPTLTLSNSRVMYLAGANYQSPPRRQVTAARSTKPTVHATSSQSADHPAIDMTSGPPCLVLLCEFFATAFNMRFPLLNQR